MICFFMFFFFFQAEDGIRDPAGEAEAEGPGVSRSCRRGIPEDHHGRNRKAPADAGRTGRGAGRGRRADAAGAGGTLPDRAGPRPLTYRPSVAMWRGSITPTRAS